MLFAGREVRIGKNCARGLEYGPRPQAEARRLLFPSFLLALIMHSCIEIQYGRQQIVFSVRKFLPPQQDLCKKTVSSIAFLNCCWVFYMFSEKIGTANLSLLSPSSLVQFSPDKHHLDISLLVKQ